MVTVTVLLLSAWVVRVPQPTLQSLALIWHLLVAQSGN